MLTYLRDNPDLLQQLGRLQLPPEAEVKSEKQILPPVIPPGPGTPGTQCHHDDQGSFEDRETDAGKNCNRRMSKILKKVMYQFHSCLMCLMCLMSLLLWPFILHLMAEFFILHLSRLLYPQKIPFYENVD